MIEQHPGVVKTATSPSEVRAALAALYNRENDIVRRLDAIVPSASGLDLELGGLDGIYARLHARLPRPESDALVYAADVASRLSSRAHELEIERKRVGDTMQMVAKVAELKTCVAGVVGSMGAPQDWETAASYLSRASRIPEHVARGAFATAMVPTIEAPGPSWTTLETAREDLCALFLREFKKAATRGDSVKVARVFKLFPLIDRGDTGLEIYSQNICQNVAETARSSFKEEAKGDHTQRSSVFYINALSKLFEHIAQVVEGHTPLVELYYGIGQMAKVIQRLQAEADTTGGVILDVWSDERAVDRKLTDIKSYPFLFLAQSMISQTATTGTHRAHSPASRGGGSQASSDEDAIDTKDIDELLNEMTLMLGRWSLYSRFIARKCNGTNSSSPTMLTAPEVLVQSILHRKFSEKLETPYVLLATFFLRRSVEKAFQIDVSPSGLSFTKPIQGNPPFIIQAVDDVMFIVDNIVRKTVSTSQIEVLTSVIPAIRRVLESDFIGVLRRRMQTESYPRGSAQGSLPPEDKIIGFIVLMNSLDTSKEYLGRITHTWLSLSRGHTDVPSLQDAFPFNHDVEVAVKVLDDLNDSFARKASEILKHCLQALLDEVVKPRTRPILLSSFQDMDYNSSEIDDSQPAQLFEERESQPVAARFEHGWDSLMKPLSRIMTPTTYTALATLASRYLAKLLEKRVWSYSGRVTAQGGVRMERDFSGIAGAVSKGDYNMREPFARIRQILLVANMEEEEWEDFERPPHWVLDDDEMHKARKLIS